MKSYKQLLMSVAGLAILLGAVATKAAEAEGDNEFASKIASGENVVLFKIHDVKPIKNDDGAVTDCEFGMTLYNRSPKSVDTATMNLAWFDQGISDVIALEENLAVEEAVKPKKREIASLKQNVSMAKTEDFASADLTTSISLPQIRPFRQVSLKSKIKSDRCFLLIENADFSFSECKVTEPTGTTTKRLSAAKGAEDTGCKSLFRFVSSRDPEYYREFQKVAFNEEQKRKEEMRKKELDEMEITYKKMINDLTAITNTLGEGN